MSFRRSRKIAHLIAAKLLTEAAAQEFDPNSELSKAEQVEVSEHLNTLAKQHAANGLIDRITKGT